MRTGTRSDLIDIARRLRQLKFAASDFDIELHDMARRLEEISRLVKDGDPIPKPERLL